MPTMTAAQKRELDRREYDAFIAVCPSRQLLDRLTDKWVTLVLCSLGESGLRYSELSRRIAGVSQKMLTQTLRNLERDGLVPVTVDYAITDLGRSLLEVVHLMKSWAEAHMDDVQAARASYDASVGA